MLQKQRLHSSKLNTNLMIQPLRLKLCRKILNRTNYVRYLGMKIDENLNWKSHIDDFASKLNRANSLLSKLRYFVSSEILRSVYFAIFQSFVNYVCLA